MGPLTHVGSYSVKGLSLFKYLINIIHKTTNIDHTHLSSPELPGDPLFGSGVFLGMILRTATHICPSKLWETWVKLSKLWVKYEHLFPKFKETYRAINVSEEKYLSGVVSLNVWIAS